MNPMPHAQARLARPYDPRRRRAWATFLAALLAILLLFAPAWQAMALIWWHNETYAHGMLVPLVSGWLVWRERNALSRLSIQGAPAALLPLTLCAMGWLIGHLAGVNALTQFSVVAMVPSLVLLCFGVSVTRQIAFPLAFLITAVPFGDFLLPWLMDRTADFTVAAVQASGVPVLREGRNLVLPTGHWSVIEACSGLRYLLAAVPLALLYGHLHLRHWRTRLAYVVIVLALALIANWIRAYLIVMLGHLSNMQLAVGVDHLLYGWVFFGLVMALAFWVGNHVPELGRPAIAPVQPDINLWRALPAQGAGALTVGLAALTLGVAPFAAAMLQDAGSSRIRMQVLRDGLAPLPAPEHGFVPGYDAKDAAIGRLPEDPMTGVAVFRFFRQHRHGEMITHSNAVLPKSPAAMPWTVRRQTVHATVTDPTTSAAPGAFIEYELDGAGGRWLAWQWFWVDGHCFTNPTEVKLATARALLSGRGDESAALVIWTPLDDSATGLPPHVPRQARQRLAELVVRLHPLARSAGL